MSKLVEHLEKRLEKVLEEFGFEKEMGGHWDDGELLVTIEIRRK